MALPGGHSGSDIDKERINAITLTARLLSSLYSKMPFNLISLEAGTVNNAIPSDAEAVISVSDEASAVSFLGGRVQTRRRRIYRKRRGGIY